MAKVKKDNIFPPALEPSLVKTSSLHADLTKAQRHSNFEPLSGEYHLVELDSSGNEIIGSDFSIGEHTFHKAFHHLIGKKFQIKKKPQK